MSRRGQRLPDGRVHFEGLRPLGNAIASVVGSIPKVSGTAAERHKLDSPSLEDRLAKRAAKLARRARQARMGMDDVETAVEAIVAGATPSPP